MAPYAACECGAEEQTAHHVVFPCPIHRSPHGAQDLTVLDDETMEWPAPGSYAAYQRITRTRSNDAEEV